MVATELLPIQSVEAVLAASPQPELRRLVVIETDDEVRLIGKVSSFYLKQLAQESIRPALGGRKLRNLVDVAVARRG